MSQQHNQHNRHWMAQPDGSAGGRRQGPEVGSSDLAHDPWHQFPTAPHSDYSALQQRVPQQQQHPNPHSGAFGEQPGIQNTWSRNPGYQSGGHDVQPPPLHYFQGPPSRSHFVQRNPPSFFNPPPHVQPHQQHHPSQSGGYGGHSVTRGAASHFGRHGAPQHYPQQSRTWSQNPQELWTQNAEQWVQETENTGFGRRGLVPTQFSGNQSRPPTMVQARQPSLYAAMFPRQTVDMNCSLPSESTSIRPSRLDSSQSVRQSARHQATAALNTTMPAMIASGPNEVNQASFIGSRPSTVDNEIALIPLPQTSGSMIQIINEQSHSGAQRVQGKGRAISSSSSGSSQSFARPQKKRTRSMPQAGVVFSEFPATQCPKEILKSKESAQQQRGDPRIKAAQSQTGVPQQAIEMPSLPSEPCPAPQSPPTEHNQQKTLRSAIDALATPEEPSLDGLPGFMPLINFTAFSHFAHNEFRWRWNAILEVYWRETDIGFLTLDRDLNLKKYEKYADIERESNRRSAEYFRGNNDGPSSSSSTSRGATASSHPTRSNLTHAEQERRRLELLAQEHEALEMEFESQMVLNELATDLKIKRMQGK